MIMTDNGKISLDPKSDDEVEVLENGKFRQTTERYAAAKMKTATAHFAGFIMTDTNDGEKISGYRTFASELTNKDCPDVVSRTGSK